MSTLATASESVARTRSGDYPIAFRQVGSAGSHREVPALAQWARDEGFAGIDLKHDATEHVDAVRAAGLTVPAADLPDWRGLICDDAERREAAIERNRAYIAACAGAGVRTFFCVLLPADPGLGRARNHELAAEGFGALADDLERHDARLAIEGWPGPGALACTPDGYAAFFRDCPAGCFGVNYDPSHLVRMGIDPLRFLDDFVDRVHHVHAKDTVVDAEARYRFGTEVGAADEAQHRWGGTWWRYAIPGHGVVDWGAVCRRLHASGYRGSVSIELEDERFADSDEAVAAGLRAARDHLRSV